MEYPVPRFDLSHQSILFLIIQSAHFDNFQNVTYSLPVSNDGCTTLQTNYHDIITQIRNQCGKYLLTHQLTTIAHVLVMQSNACPSA